MDGISTLDILFIGYSYADEQCLNAMRANCSCTLVRTSNGRRIIVDTGTAWDGEKLLAAIARHSLTADDINIVVCTHGHSDHIGCNYLFQKAEYHIVGQSISNRDLYIDWDGSVPFQLSGDEVTLERTPGHTLGCVSVLVRNTPLGGLVGICGDLFERLEDIEDGQIWLEAGSENPKLQREHRLCMAERCDYIVPGHGPGFVVTAEMRDKLRSDVNSYITDLAKHESI